MTEHAAEAARLRTLMKEWQSKAGDTLAISEKNRTPEAVDLTGMARTPDKRQRRKATKTRRTSAPCSRVFINCGGRTAHAGHPEWIVRKYFETPGEARN